MTTAPNLALWYPTLAHFRHQASQADTVEKVNALIKAMKKARVSSVVHRFNEYEIRDAWGVIQEAGEKIDGAYRLPSDGTWRMRMSDKR